MGNNPCMPEQNYVEPAEEEHIQQVQEILDNFPETLRNSMFRGSTTRYSDLSVLNQDSNRYIFLLKIDGQEIRVVIPVINELAHRALVENYKLVVGKEMILDPFDQRIESVFIPVRSESKSQQYSMRVVPFRGYNNLIFKRVLQEIWLYTTIKKKRDRLSEDPSSLILLLHDFFIYGVDSDQQAVILLYERVQGSLVLSADYRWKACQHWKVGERLKIFRDVVKGCMVLSELGIMHRDVRASNIFYSEKQKKYLLGGFSCAREVKNQDNDDLLTVSGIENQTSGKLKQLLSSKQNVSLLLQRWVYTELEMEFMISSGFSIGCQIAEELQISWGNHSSRKVFFINIENLLSSQEPLEDVLRAVEGGIRVADRSGEFEDEAAITSKSFKLLPFRHRDLCERYLFKVYCILGYQMQFSEMAHKMIEKNNIEGNPFRNAKILKELGLFYQKHGTGGSEYLLNSCVLYCKETESEIERGLFEDATLNIEQGEEIYIHLSGAAGEFAMSMIELKRLRTELRARTLWQIGPNKYDAERLEILQFMSKALQLGADQNLPIEKQMRMFLTWGVVHRECGDRAAAEERFRNGLAVCENQGSFESHQSASLLKSHFLYEIAVMKLDSMQDQHDPLLAHDKQTYSPEDLPKQIENWLQESLEIREKESTRPYQPILCYMSLGKLYMLENEYLQAKVQLKRALIRLMDLEKDEKIAYEIKVEVHYDLGSINYKLQDYQESVDHYREAIVMLQDKGGDPYWTNVIAGNLGLAYLRAGLNERGKTLLEKSKEAIKAQHGAYHYDFLFLTSQEELINSIPST